MSVSGRKYAPELFPAARLAAADFDQTLALTFTTAPTGIGVHEAYAQAIDALYGPTALDRFHADGGLRNRAVSEVVQDLFPDMQDDEVAAQAQRITNHKLTILLGQIDNQWPLPTKGFIECWDRIGQCQRQGKAIDTAVISAGYAPFIQKTFDVWGAPRPDILVTTETINNPALPEPFNERNKPAPLSMRLALNHWLGLYGLPENPEMVADAATRAIYTGDDPYKDGKLAEHFGIPFVLLSPDNAAESWKLFSLQLGIGSLSLQKAMAHDNKK